MRKVIRSRTKDGIASLNGRDFRSRFALILAFLVPAGSKLTQGTARFVISSLHRYLEDSIPTTSRNNLAFAVTSSTVKDSRVFGREMIVILRPNPRPL